MHYENYRNRSEQINFVVFFLVFRAFFGRYGVSLVLDFTRTFPTSLILYSNLKILKYVLTNKYYISDTDLQPSYQFSEGCDWSTHLAEFLGEKISYVLKS